MPQLLRSVSGSLQPPAQACWVLRHEATQAPPLHTLPGWHVAPHEPQFFESTCRSTHLSSQAVHGTGAEPTHVVTLRSRRIERGRTPRSVPSTTDDPIGI